jgi:hypothetical protein
MIYCIVQEISHTLYYQNRYISAGGKILNNFKFMYINDKLTEWILN